MCVLCSAGIEFPRYPAPKVDVPRHAYGKEIWKVGDQGARNSDSEPEKKRHPLPGGVQPVSRTSFINFLVGEGRGGRGIQRKEKREPGTELPRNANAVDAFVLSRFMYATVQELPAGIRIKIFISSRGTSAKFTSAAGDGHAGFPSAEIEEIY